MIDPARRPSTSALTATTSISGARFRPAAFVIAVLLGVAPVRAGAATQPDAAADDHSDDLAEAQRLYEEGRAAYETFNYDAAIELWTTALARTPKTADAGGVRNALVYNLAAAQLKAHALDHEEVRLKRARLLLARYLEEEQRAGSADPEDVARVEAQMKEIDLELSKADAPPPVASAPPPRPVHAPPPERKRGTGMLAAGATLLVVGGGLAGAMVAGIVRSRRSESRLGELDTIESETERPRVVERGELGNRLAIASGAVASVAVASGIALVVVGKRRRDASRTQGGVAITGISPMFGRGLFGIGAQVRL